MAQPMLSDSGAMTDEQTVIGACCCNTTSFNKNECKPGCNERCCAVFCGQTGKNLNLCIEDSVSCCLCKEHDLFDQTLTGPYDKPDVCCILCHHERNLVKPWCLSGAKPCCKGYSDGCCLQKRVACPNDVDVPGMYACYTMKICNTDPFACDFQPPCATTLPPLSKDAQSASLEVADAIPGDEYLLCGLCCCLCTMYVPDSYTDAIGCSDESLHCLCYSNECKGCLLPKTPGPEVDELLLLAAGQTRVVKPPIAKGGPCCKGVTRIFCTVSKFAFPCDKEVPFVCAIAGSKVFERTIEGQMKFGDDKVIDPATGRKPMFSQIKTITPKSAKVKMAAEPQDMQRT